MKRCSTSLAISKTQIKTIVKYHFIAAGITVMKKTDNTKGWQGHRIIETLLVGMQKWYSHSESGLVASYEVKYILST